MLIFEEEVQTLLMQSHDTVACSTAPTVQTMSPCTVLIYTSKLHIVTQACMPLLHTYRLLHAVFLLTEIRSKY